jgi:uncharacterized Zn-finger protein
MKKCQVCLKDFKRTEHLARHFLTHSGAKPFDCHSCHKSFARLDSLKRHQRLHDTPDSRQEPLSPPPSPQNLESDDVQVAIGLISMCADYSNRIPKLSKPIMSISNLIT